jgi:hypothetical protein
MKEEDKKEIIKALKQLEALKQLLHSLLKK